ncbi:MAG: hypothetical protein QOH56_2783 [Pseudonocardiales bacterium]|jgi:hypothetical protein|nr:hypothetical protein [Pseudonocardiales bacterium]
MVDTILDGGDAFTVFDFSGNSIAPRTDPAYAIGRTVIGALDLVDDPARWRVRVDGWDSSTGSTMVITQRPAADVSDVSPSFRMAKDLVLLGSVQVRDPGDRDAALSRLKQALSFGATVITRTEFGVSKSTVVYCPGGVTVVRYPSPNLATFTAQLKAPDSRKLGIAIPGKTRLPSSIGGLVVPFTVPFAINSTVVSGQVNLFNPGDATGPVKLRIDGPCTGPRVTHVTSGTQLIFAANLVLTAGEWLEVDMDNKIVLANGQASRAGLVTQRGWSGFDPGDNTWAFTAAAADPAALLTVTAWPAWI